jgi:hypothetical protein
VREQAVEDPRSEEEAYRRMQEHLRALNRLMQQIPDVPPGIGHNQPPEPIDDAALDADDRPEITQVIEVIEAHPLK